MGSIREGRKPFTEGERLVEEGKQFEQAKFDLNDIKEYKKVVIRLSLVIDFTPPKGSAY